MSELVFVKLGGSLITDKSRPYTIQQPVLDRLCQEIRRARAQRPGLSLVLGNGAGSFAHISAARHATHRGIVDEAGWRGFAEVHHDAARLATLVREALTRAGEPAVTLQPGAACVTRGGRIADYQQRPIQMLLEAGVIPLVHGDVCVDESQGCAIASTEEILRHLASVLAPARVILVGKVDGVLDAEGRLIPAITRADLPAVRSALQASDGVADVTGGMLQKVQAALEFGVRAQVINGQQPGRLERALLGEPVPGTTIEG